MSWPFDGLPRFKPSSAYGSSEGGHSAVAHVFDRAYYHRIVETCRAGTIPAAEEQARKRADRLNREYARQEAA